METERNELLNQAIAAGASEPIRRVLIRMPQSLHAALKADAHAAHKSLNQLCIDRLQRLPVVTGENDG